MHWFWYQCPISYIYFFTVFFHIFIITKKSFPHTLHHHIKLIWQYAPPPTTLLPLPHCESQRRIIFILCAFAGCLEILNLQKSALWADRLTCLSEVCNVTSLRGLLMLLADFCRFIAVLVNNAFKTVQQSAKDKEDICRRANARQRYLTQDFTLWWAGLRCIIY